MSGFLQGCKKYISIALKSQRFCKTRSRTKCDLKGLGYPNKDAKRTDTDIFALLARISESDSFSDDLYEHA